MKNKILVIGVIEREDSILMRKKPDGSKPYKETWYSFGAESTGEDTPENIFKTWVFKELGIKIEIKKRLGWDTEVKVDHDGEIKNFVYLDILCEYISGETKIPDGAEKVEWIPKEELSSYEIVPPSITLFKKLGYL
jgi:hypothetical protein